MVSLQTEKHYKHISIFSGFDNAQMSIMKM